ncbi:MAG: hydrogenase nickel incorporation protein HypB [Nanobdellota archaeon]
MCEECGCEENKETIKVEKDLRQENDKMAAETKHKLLHKKVYPINLMGSPGSGKTTLIQNLANYLNPEEIAVIQGDLESDIDKKKLEKDKILTYQINTHSGCHLNSAMVRDALENMQLQGKKYLIIENVGNLVCPAGVKLGQDFNIVVSSTAEGADKPKKYPVIFNEANLVVISKMDIAKAVNFKREDYIKDLKQINPDMKIIETTNTNKESYKKIAEIIRQNHEKWEETESKHQH